MFFHEWMNWLGPRRDLEGAWRETIQVADLPWVSKIFAIVKPEN
jgi:hypothetical protein